MVDSLRISLGGIVMRSKDAKKSGGKRISCGGAKGLTGSGKRSCWTCSQRSNLGSSLRIIRILSLLAYSRNNKCLVSCVFIKQRP